MVIGIAFAVLCVAGIARAVSIYRGGLPGVSNRYRLSASAFMFLLALASGVMSVMWLMKVIT